ncbi:glycoside hydrolase family 25 protein [Eubacterium pyruvativorans]|uniref:glycoside hydrolase family 25 protein n=1 Tax=Eubacterium pyruvativorans TaxID=155865 RepID=UPI000E8CC4EC|nr:glycoside hydrolase family 25 protein [Eubacterium pyruvativorans]MDD6707704.1 glycoside hydrolase family 25 protein [Eubacterium pyruvativorans]MDY4050061.1 glycoside hydrolase family 25 protein [Eubacterium pyruvativorans]HAT82986.1 hypothetical protein [Eubacterium sp.]
MKQRKGYSSKGNLYHRNRKPAGRRNRGTSSIRHFFALLFQNRWFRGGIALLLVLLLFGTLRSCMQYRYDGPDPKQAIRENPYQSESFYFRNGLRYYRDARYVSEVGIDVSSHQGKINWNQVASTGVKFAFVRVGYRGSTAGRIYEDPYFRRNLTGAKQAGLKVGVYFYSMAANTKEAVEEARYVVRALKGYDIDYTVTFDLEVSESSHQGSLSAEEATRITDAFCKYVKRQGYEPMIYGNPAWLQNNVDLSRLTAYPVWLAHYTAETGYPYIYKMWQYSSAGRLAGISGRTDMNVMMIPRG